MDVIAALIAVWVIVTLIPFPVYMLASKYAGLAEPENPSAFFASVLVQKVGTTVGFVLLYKLADGAFDGRWLGYALVWLAMYAITEIGQAMGPHYGWKEAWAGIVAEAIYFPLAGWATMQILG